MLIKKDTFEGMTTDSKLDTLFDMMVLMCGKIDKLKNLSLWYKGLALAGGIVGGIMGSLAILQYVK